jgi:hypothetical protein
MPQLLAKQASACSASSFCVCLLSSILPAWQSACLSACQAACCLLGSFFRLLGARKQLL